MDFETQFRPKERARKRKETEEVRSLDAARQQQERQRNDRKDVRYLRRNSVIF